MAEFENNEAHQAEDAHHADVQLALDRPEALAILAHELRTPLAPIRNGTELLRTLCTDPRQAQIVEMMSRQVVHLTCLLDDVLEAARLRRGIVSLDRRSIDSGVIVQDALDGIAASVVEVVLPIDTSPAPLQHGTTADS